MDAFRRTCGPLKVKVCSTTRTATALCGRLFGCSYSARRGGVRSVFVATGVAWQVTGSSSTLRAARTRSAAESESGGWPVWGAALWVVAGILLESVVGTTLAFVGASVVALSAGLAAYRAAKPCAARVRTIGVVLPAGSPNMGRRAARDQLLRLSESLAFADELRAAGRLSPLDYEVVWSSAYHQMRPPSLSHEQFDDQRKETP